MIGVTQLLTVPVTASIGPYDIQYLSVAGGGAGGSRYYGGGGGGGGFLTNTYPQVAIGTVMTITVGAGGAGPSNGQGGNGGNSTISATGITTVTSTGGGGGGGSTSGGSSLANGKSGGSGGGLRVWSSPSTWIPGQGVSGQGHQGGEGSTTSSNYSVGPNVAWNSNNYLSKSWGSGGGGAGNVGYNCHWMSNMSTPGQGGVGATSNITGSSVYYAGGGSGGQNANNGSGSSGYGPYTTGRLGCTRNSLGGGGSGGKGYYSPYYTAEAGTTNLGGGGGGGSHSSATNGGAGGSGVVILKVPTTSYSGTSTGSPTVTTSGDYTILKFTGDGTYTT